MWVPGAARCTEGRECVGGCRGGKAGARPARTRRARRARPQGSSTTYKSAVHVTSRSPVAARSRGAPRTIVEVVAEVSKAYCADMILATLLAAASPDQPPMANMAALLHQNPPSSRTVGRNAVPRVPEPCPDPWRAASPERPASLDGQAPPLQNVTRTTSLTTGATTNPAAQQLSLPVTGSWDTWSAVTANVALPAGLDLVELSVGPDDSGSVNIDSLQHRQPHHRIMGSVAATFITGGRSACPPRSR
jgi:carbohydrate binding protein with CBM6 domain